MSRSQDLIQLIKGIQLVANASVKTQQKYLKHLLSHSSVVEVLEKGAKQSQEFGKQIIDNPSQEVEKLNKIIKEAFERTSVVAEGIKYYKNSAISPPVTMEISDGQKSFTRIKDIGNLDIASITLNELESLLQEHSKHREATLKPQEYSTPKWLSKKTIQRQKSIPTVPDVNIVTAETRIDKQEPVKTIKIESISAPKKTPKAVPSAAVTNDENNIKNMLSFITNYDKEAALPQSALNGDKIAIPSLNTVAKQRTVPSSRISRVASFGSLFAGLGVGTATELVKGAVGLGGSKNVKEALFSPQNAERIVDTLCKVRGAALKLGQILSIQDSNVVSPQLIKAFDRVRQAADYMPDWQVEKVMVKEFGKDWRTKFCTFEDKPFAAASIGQVHRGTTLDGIDVAVKIQYPGVAESIESDIDNLVTMLKVWNVFPPGIFIDNVVKVAKRELTWEVDYNREAEFTINFGEMIQNYPQFRVPKLFKDLSTNRVITTELVPGVPMDQCFNMSEEHRSHIAKMAMQLVLLELFRFRCMQTDPNWSNFLYDEKTKKLMLIDFGATRFYTKEFMDNYLKVIIAATEDDRDMVHKLSVEMGFLTGYETAAMEKAHVDAVMILGEVFSVEGEFDFGAQKTTKRIADLVPVMIAHRLCPPPEEIYSLHRKISGVFLLCYQLRAKIACKPLFMDIVKNYEY
ncbi:unnamed protein product [Diamesa serratosioi]